MAKTFTRRADGRANPIFAEHVNELQRYLEELSAQVLRVRDYGALGDGATDNATAFASVAAAANAMTNTNGAPVIVEFTGKAGANHYKYSSGLMFTRPVILRGFGDPALDYTGTGHAIKFGPDGLDDTNWQLHRIYGCDGMVFTGGSSMTHGLYFNDHITEPYITNTKMIDFGCANGYAIFFQSDNWDINIHDLHWYTNENAPTGKKNLLRVNGYSTGAVSDNGQSRLSASKVRALHHQIGPGGGVSSGLGMWLDGTVNLLQDVHLSGFEPNIRLGSRADYTRIEDCYFESFEQVESNYCIEYGDPAGGHDPSGFLTNVHIEDSYANCHNTDAGTTIAFVGPTTASTGISNWHVNRNELTAYTATRPLVVQNDLANQLGNRASDNGGVAVIHTVGTNITNWAGNQGSNPLFRNFEDKSLFANLQPGSTADQSAGLQLMGWNASLKAQVYYSPGANRIILQHVAGGNKIAALDSSGDWRVDGKLWLAGVAFANTVVTKTANYTATDTDQTVLCNNSGGAITITLPAASTRSGKEYIIKQINTQNIVVDGNASETIDGATTKTLGSQYAFIHIVCDGTNWFIVAQAGTVT